jgi:hypothetical protein
MQEHQKTALEAFGMAVSGVCAIYWADVLPFGPTWLKVLTGAITIAASAITFMMAYLQFRISQKCAGSSSS